MEMITDELIETARGAVRVRVREVMGRERRSYAELAERAGVGKATVTRFLNGDARSGRYWPRDDQLAGLSRAVGFDLAEALEQEVARALMAKLGPVFGDGSPFEGSHDTLVIGFGPNAFEGLSRQEVLEVASASELGGLARLAEVRGRRRERSPELAATA